MYSPCWKSFQTGIVPIAKIKHKLFKNSQHYSSHQKKILMVLKRHFQQYFNMSWRSVLLVEKTGGPKENRCPVACH